MIAIDSQMVDDEVLHFATLEDGTTVEGWGDAGIEKIISGLNEDDYWDQLRGLYKVLTRDFREGDFSLVTFSLNNLERIVIRSDGTDAVYTSLFHFYES